MTNNLTQRPEADAPSLEHRIENAKEALAPNLLEVKACALRGGFDEKAAAEIAALWVDVKARYRVLDGPVEDEE